MNRNFKKALLIITFISVVTTGIIFRQPFYRMLPLMISLFVVFVQAEVNRYAFIAGGINSVLYTIVYMSLGLYANAAYAFFFSFPVQIITFINWNRHSYEKATELKKMTTKERIIWLSVFVALWAGVFAALTLSGSEYAVLDNTASLLGIASTFLVMFAYIEYTYISVVSVFISLFLNLQVFRNDITHITYVIFSCYNIICGIIGFINVKKLYKKQQDENNSL